MYLIHTLAQPETLSMQYTIDNTMYSLVVYMKCIQLQARNQTSKGGSTSPPPLNPARGVGKRCKLSYGGDVFFYFKFSYVLCNVSWFQLQGRRTIWDRGDTSPNIWTGGHYHECPPQYF